MRSSFFRIVGIALIIASIGGLIFSLAGLVSIWILRPTIKNNIMENVELFRSALETTAEGLAIADASLHLSIESVSALQVTVDATARSIDATIPMISTLTDLTKEDLPEVVENAQTSLVAAQESARIIDSVLTALASIPFVPRDIYNPPVPLHIALERVSESMDTLPIALKTIEDSLAASGENLEIIQGDIDRMSTDISGIRTSLLEAESVIAQYEDLVASMLERIRPMEERLPFQIDITVWVISFILVWAAIAQVGLLIQGWDLLTRVRTYAPDL